MCTISEGVLVTGATGLIGYHVACELALDERLNTVCIVRSGSNPQKLAALDSRGVVLEEGSFLDPDTMDRIFKTHSIRYVVHLAALRGGGAGSSDEYARVNVEGTESLLRLSLQRDIRRFLFCSSVGVFGTIPQEVPAGEGTPLNGDNLYHASKVQAEAKVAEFVSKGLDARIVRPTVTYGIEDDGFPTTLVELVKSRKFVLCGGDVRVHMLDAVKFAEFVRLILRRNGLERNTFLVADAGPVSLKYLVDGIHRYHHGASYPRYLRMPRLLFRTAAVFFKMIRNEKWLARTLLISRDWHFDLRATLEAVPEFMPARTEDRFVAAMCAKR
jgi:nucleoside-diphosphate-sugar epimerase